jgi:glutathione S-transferase
MKLYYSPGACSLAAHIALREVDRPFDLERVDLRTRRTAAGVDFRTINPKGYVPALQVDTHGKTILTELAPILQYIADLAPEHGLAPPAGSLERYQLQEWLNFTATEIHKQFSPLFHPDTPPFTQERSRSKLGERFLYLSDVLTDRAYLMGETFTVADCYMFSLLRWGDRFELDLQIWPNLDDYFQRIFDRPAVQAALGAEGLLEHKRYRRTA